ncbi:MAG: phosphoglucosamine mutase, phosphoglucosamine mutase [Deltaproteobacteria bacterium CSP1-8]|nr:MAG: phosphoglucosamine mutase, phosphoglucosamine mutase [Deltaproteobacteria bacterium CSP1-8]
MRRELFGTDGVRGVANIEPMTVETAMALGQAVAYSFRNHSGRHKIVIGKDTRLSGYMFETALSAGICSMGGDVMLVGPLPTPGIAFLTHSMRADAGVVISASHNPYQDNGIKFFGRDGFKLPDGLEAKIEMLMLGDHLKEVRPPSPQIGRAHRIDDATGRYIVYLKNTFPGHLSLEGLRIVIDCANGAAYRIAPQVFQELGADVIPVAVSPNGLNINDKCGSLYPELVSAKVKEHRAGLGISLDGDADRVIVVDHRGEVVDGDRIMAICAEELARKKKLKKNTVVATVMSNIGLELFLRERKIRMARAPVGDRYVVEAMRAGGYNFGGEQSGHLIFLDHATTGDGVLAALQVLAVMVESGKPIADLGNKMVTLPQILVNLKLKQRVPLESLPRFQKAKAEFEKKLGGRGRILVRYSGTEPVLRIMVEGEDRAETERIVNALAEKARAEIK